jgi:alpha-L-rhamnosidase
MSIPAGAAGRGERNGWTGDAAMAAESELFDFDTAAFFSRYVEQVLDSQCPDGELGNGVPPAGSNTSLHECGGPASVERVKDPNWGQVLVQILYYLWKASNATSTVDRAWGGVEAYMDFLASNFSVSANTGSEWGDWQAAVEKPRIVCDKREGIPQQNVTHCPTDSQPGLRTITHITASAAVVMNHLQAAELAAATGRHAAAVKYATLAEEMKRQYHAAFFDPAAKIYGDGTSTAFACALWLEVTPEPLRAAVVENFVKHIESLRYRVVHRSPRRVCH